LTIPADTLEKGSTYKLEALMFYYKSALDPISSAMKMITVKKGPIGGTVAVDPIQGFSQVAMMTISAPGWYLEDSDQALKYQYFIKPEG
jgi:hypothetical protein